MPTETEVAAKAAKSAQEELAQTLLELRRREEKVRSTGVELKEKAGKAVKAGAIVVGTLVLAGLFGLRRRRRRKQREAVDVEAIALALEALRSGRLGHKREKIVLKEK